MAKTGDLFKLVHLRTPTDWCWHLVSIEACTVGKEAVRILLECFLVILTATNWNPIGQYCWLSDEFRYSICKCTHDQRKWATYLFCTIVDLLPPANEVCGKVIFLHLSVILFTGGSTWAGTPPLGSGTPHPRPGTHPSGPGTPPGLGTPPPRPGTHPRTRYSPQDQVHPLGPGTPPPRDQVHPQTRYTTPGTRYTPRAVHAGRYEQRAGGTHPTGMHSCY